MLATDHPMGDFGFCPFTWTTLQQQRFFQLGKAPAFVHHLPAHTPIVPFYYYSRHAETTFHGPLVTAPQFRRLNCCKEHRLIMWDLWGSDDDDLCPLAVVPSEDLCPTDAHRSAFASNIKVNKKEDQTDRMPLVLHLMRSGLFAFDYILGNQGPNLYDNDTREQSIGGSLWSLLHSFCGAAALQHPEGHECNAASYRHPLWKIHQCWVENDDMQLMGNNKSLREPI